MSITHDSVVTLHYTVSAEDGTELDSSRDNTPMTVLLGKKYLIEGLENALLGKSTGDKFNIDVPPEQAYGERNDSLVQAVPKAMFEGMEVEAGMSFRASTDEGEQSVIILDVTDEEVIVDGNHPLAGIPLHFDVEIMAVRVATADEIAHGHAHGPEGCGHHH